MLILTALSVLKIVSYTKNKMLRLLKLITDYRNIINYMHIYNVCKHHLWGKYKLWSNIHVHDKNFIKFCLGLWFPRFLKWNTTFTVSVHSQLTWPLHKFILFQFKYKKGIDNHIFCHKHEYYFTIYTYKHYICI